MPPPPVPSAFTYRRRSPEKEPLYQVLAGHLETFLAQQHAADQPRTRAIAVPPSPAQHLTAPRPTSLAKPQAPCPAAPRGPLFFLSLCQIAFLEQIGGAPAVDTVRVPRNYWGTGDPAVIRQRLWHDDRVRALAYEPFATAFINEALPDWRAFEW